MHLLIDLPKSQTIDLNAGVSLMIHCCFHDIMRLTDNMQETIFFFNERDYTPLTGVIKKFGNN